MKRAGFYMLILGLIFWSSPGIEASVCSQFERLREPVSAHSHADEAAKVGGSHEASADACCLHLFFRTIDAAMSVSPIVLPNPVLSGELAFTFGLTAISAFGFTADVRPLLVANRLTSGRVAGHLYAFLETYRI